MSQPKTRIWILLVPVPSILKFPRLKRDNFPLFETLFWLRVVQTQTVLFLKSMSERGGSDIERL